MQIPFGDVLTFPGRKLSQSVNIGLHGLFIFLCKPDLITPKQSQVEKPGVVGREDELCMVRIDGGILHHFDQVPGQEWVHTGFNLVYHQNSPRFQSSEPHTDARKKSLCSNGFLPQRKPEALGCAIFSVESV